LDRLRRSSFRIRIEKSVENNEEVWWFGTGFFAGGHGYALTAFHNLPANVKRQGAGTVDIFYRNLTDPLRLEYCPGLSTSEADIAVLKLADVGNTVFDWVDLAYLPLGLGEAERKEAWRRMGRLYVFRFPVRGVWRPDGLHTAQPDHLVEGRVARQVFGEVSEYDSSAKRTLVTKRLHIDGDRILALGGMNGGPVLDARTGLVVAVEGSYDPDSRVVFASELAPLAELWRDAPTMTSSLTIHALAQRPPTQPVLMGRARQDLDPSVNELVKEELKAVFPDADTIVVYDYFQGFTSDQQAEVVLGVEVKSADHYDTHVVKLGRRDRVANDYEGFQQCLQGEPFASRILVRINRQELDEGRMAIVYQNAYQFYG
jgi:hypothetical protein